MNSTLTAYHRRTSSRMERESPRRGAVAWDAARS
jgi:hypothetical protein